MAGSRSETQIDGAVTRPNIRKLLNVGFECPDFLAHVQAFNDCRAVYCDGGWARNRVPFALALDPGSFGGISPMQSHPVWAGRDSQIHPKLGRMHAVAVDFFVFGSTDIHAA